MGIAPVLTRKFPRTQRQTLGQPGSRRPPRRLPRDTNQSLLVAANDHLLAQSQRDDTYSLGFFLSQSFLYAYSRRLSDTPGCLVSTARGPQGTLERVQWLSRFGRAGGSHTGLVSFPSFNDDRERRDPSSTPTSNKSLNNPLQIYDDCLWRETEGGGRREGRGGTWERRGGGVVAVEVGAAVAVKYTPVTKTILLGSEPVYLLGLRQSLRTHFPHSTSPSFCQGRQPNHPGWTCVGWVDKNP